MEKQLQYFNRLTSDTAEYLRSVHGFSIRTIGHYKGGWRIIKEYMIAKKLRKYSATIGKKVLNARFNKRGIRCTPDCHFLCIVAYRLHRQLHFYCIIWVYTIEPKGILIIGNTKELSGNESIISCFEGFRRNTTNPEIVTFDELFERAKFM